MLLLKLIPVIDAEISMVNNTNEVIPTLRIVQIIQTADAHEFQLFPAGQLFPDGNEILRLAKVGLKNTCSLEIGERNIEYIILCIDCI